MIIGEPFAYSVFYKDGLRELQADVENLNAVKMNLTQLDHIGEQELRT
jgi:hypothetical protein